jgi:hypothetical protein
VKYCEPTFFRKYFNNSPQTLARPKNKRYEVVNHKPILCEHYLFGGVTTSVSAFTNSTAVHKDTERATCKLLGLEISALAIGLSEVPNTSSALACAAWMHDHFEKIGDQQPSTQWLVVDD